MYWEDNSIKTYHETHDLIFILQTIQLLKSGTFFLTYSVGGLWYPHLLYLKVRCTFRDAAVRDPHGQYSF